MNDNPKNSQQSFVAPGFFRRIAAMLYDGLLLLALILVTTASITLPLGMPSGAGLVFYQILLFELIPLLFFCGFWVKGGQTLGMRAWKLRVIRKDGSPVSWMDALKRHFAALLSWLALGLGFLWILVDPERLAWHDRLSNTRLQRLDQ
ncbi:MAG: RDD family protein [Gammaproteobacteria bacterium]|nr:RDD family protein [Gammaproteobacteria bacterium]